MIGRRVAALLACVAALVGCASSEGGVTGTGVSAISGNVVMVSAQGAEPAPLPFPVRVSVAEFPAIADTTDANGSFRLSGAFSGSITLQFADAADGTSIGPLSVELPAGAQMVLENIEIDTSAPPPDRVQPQAVRLFDVFGRVDAVECGDDGTGTILLTDAGRPPRQVMVSITAATEIASRDGVPLTCADILTGAFVGAQGFLRRDDLTIVALAVVVSPTRPPRPSPAPRPERLQGVVAAVSCQRGLVVVEQDGAIDPVERIVKLTDRTEFECGSELPTPCDCSAIAVGEPLGVAGTIFPDQPGQIRAGVVVVGSTSVVFDAIGVIAAVRCVSDVLALRVAASGELVRVALDADTQFLCADVSCQCDDLRAGVRARVQGQRDIGTGVVSALRVTRLR